MTQRPRVDAWFDTDSCTVSYLATCEETGACAIIDPVLDFEACSGRTATHSAEVILGEIEARGLNCELIIETHVHADHLSGAPFLRKRLGAPIAIGAHIAEVQRAFAPIYALEGELDCDGAPFDRLLDDEARFSVGKVKAQAFHTPGHTPACMSYLIGDALFVGDTLFMPDFGTARCDFPGGDARALYRSIQRLYALPDETRVFTCHDYKAPGRDHYAWETTLAQQKTGNVHIHAGVSEDEFVAMRTERDAILPMPRLMLPSVQVNIAAGELPDEDPQGRRFLKLPLNAF
ncbi:MAG: MBL fold metallo-hydrolase [Pseudomonadota bacterium]